MPEQDFEALSDEKSKAPTTAERTKPELRVHVRELKPATPGLLQAADDVDDGPAQ